MNLAYRDIKHNLLRFVLTNFGLSLLLGIVVMITGVYGGLIDDALRQARAANADLWVIEAGTNGPFAEASRIAGDTRGLGERTIGAGLDYPEIGIGGARLPQGIVNQAAIDAGNHDHDAEQQAQSKVGQDEAQQVVLDVPVGQIHRIGSSAIVAARPTRNPLRNCTTTCTLSGKPPTIS